MSRTANMNVKLRLKQAVITPEAREAVCDEDTIGAVLRHICGDWGVVDEKTWKANDEALKSGSRISAKYVDRRGSEFLIVTDEDRSATILLPQDD